MASTTAYSRPAGCLDVDAGEARRRAEAEARLLAVFAAYGYERVEVPTIEYADLYHPERIGLDLYHSLLSTQVSGAERFPPSSDDGPGGERGHAITDVVLRPGFTAPIARWFAVRLVESGVPPYLPARLAYAGQVFRNLEPGPGRLKEFRQAGIELVGSDSTHGDREVLAVACRAARALELTGWRLNLGQRQLFRELLAGLGVDPGRAEQVANHLELAARIHEKASDDDSVFLAYVHSFVRAHRDRLPPEHPGVAAPEALSAGEWRAELTRLHDAYLRRLWADPRRGVPAGAVDEVLALSAIGGEPSAFFAAVRPFLRSDAVRRLATELEALAAWLVEAHAAPVRMTPAASRGITYYTGVTFEVHAAIPGVAPGDVCGGGRYDHLHSWVYRRALATQALRGERSAPAVKDDAALLGGVGLAFGIERAAAALARDPPGGGAQVFVAVVDDALAGDALALAERLRDLGLKVECHVPGTRRPLGLREQLGHADRIGAAHAVIVGPDEWPAGEVTVRDLARREQRRMALAAALEALAPPSPGGAR